MENKRLKALIKFGKKDHIQNMLDGLFYFSNAETFRKMEDEQGVKAQGDKWEGSLPLRGFSSASMSNIETNETITFLGNVNADVILEHINKTPVFCMTGCFENNIKLENNKLSFSFHPDIIKTIKKDFKNPDSAVVILDPDSFLKDINKVFNQTISKLQYIKYRNHDSLLLELLEILPTNNYIEQGNYILSVNFQEQTHFLYEYDAWKFLLYKNVFLPISKNAG